MGILDSIGNAASQVGGVFKGAGEALWETGEGLVDLGAGVAKTAYDLGPGGLVTDGYEQLTGNQAPDWMPSAERGMQRLEGAAEVAATIARNPGLLVDAVSDIVSLEETDLQSVPDTVADAEHGFLTALATRGEHMVSLLDLDRLVEGRTVAALNAPETPLLDAA